MTKEDAIKMLESKMDGNTDTSYEWAETVRMAIKALEQSTSEDCVSRQAVKEGMLKYGFHAPDMTVTEFIEDELLPVTSTHGTCKDCKHWKDKDGIYRRGLGAESKCDINTSKVFEGTFYCADFVKRGSENEVN